ncbi:MAG TPA: hypothetical protein VGV57_14105 [Thermoleophilaceae bacterium]|nr:hypothetical protein [Thermoleophilaceae bacterium]
MNAIRGRLGLVVTAVAAVAVIGVLGIVLLGSGDEEATRLLDRAFTEPIGSADVALDAMAQVNGVQELEQPIRLQVRGPYRTGGNRRIPSADLAVNISTSGQSFSGGLVSTGRNAFVEVMGQEYEVGEQNVAQANQQIAAGAGRRRSLSDFGIDPRRWLEDPEIEGDEQVAGTATTRVNAGLDVGRMLDDLNTLGQRTSRQVGGPAPRRLTAEDRERIARIVEEPEFDVFVGKADGKIRRLATVVELEVPEEDRQAVGGARSGEVSFSIEFSNVGSPQRITPPRRARPIRELTSQLLQLFGGAAGAGDAPGAGAPGGAVPSPGGARP